MKSCMEIMLSRRSVKKYLPDMPKKADVDKVIEAGLAAASGQFIFLFQFGFLSYATRA